MKPYFSLVSNKNLYVLNIHVMIDMLNQHLVHKIASFLIDEDVHDLSTSCKYLYSLLFNREYHIKHIRNTKKLVSNKNNIHNIIRKVKDSVIVKGTCFLCHSRKLLHLNTLPGSSYSTLSSRHFVCIDDCKFSCLLCNNEIKITQTQFIVEPVLCPICFKYCSIY